MPLLRSIRDTSGWRATRFQEPAAAGVGLESLIVKFTNGDGSSARRTTVIHTESATAIYRIAQEALRNVSKHAGKTHVKMVLSGSDTGLQLRVMDFGLGFDQEFDMPTPGLGMISMQERARLAGGTATVQSPLGQGTTIIADIPLDRHA